MTPKPPRSTRGRGIAIFCLVGIVMLGCDSGPTNVEVAPDTPVLFSPPNGSTDQENAVYLEWRDSDNATRYHVQVSEGSDFTDLTFDRLDQSAPIVAVNDLAIGTTYYWRIRAYNEEKTSTWSAPYWFKPATMAEIPETPSLIFPANEQTELPRDVEFQWQSVPDARFYHIQASQTKDFYNQEANMETLTSTSQRVTQLIQGYTYFWRVRARNAAGFSPWSPTWEIIIESAN